MPKKPMKSSLVVRVPDEIHNEVVRRSNTQHCDKAEIVRRALYAYFKIRPAAMEVAQ